MKYDYLIVGSGLFGAVFAREMVEAGKTVFLIDKRNHIGGNVYTKDRVHVYGPHAFHTNSEDVWKYVNKFSSFNNYQHRVKATFGEKVFSLPFNMATFYQLWGCRFPDEAKRKINSLKIKINNPKNLEEWALSQVGEEIYQILIYGYTKKQWMREPKKLPASIIKRIPLRFTWNDNYFDDKYQGVPIDGYTKLVENILGDINLKTETDFFDIKNWKRIADKLVYSGPIDEFLNYKYGDLEYLTLKFLHKKIKGDHQGIAQMNYTDENVPYTRVIEHKHFYFSNDDESTTTLEYPDEWGRGKIPYYPVNDKKNNKKYDKYLEEVRKMDDVIIGGRLGGYRYFNMDQTIASALNEANKELKKVKTMFFKRSSKN